jgi:hypothetical protein
MAINASEKVSAFFPGVCCPVISHGWFLNAGTLLMLFRGPVIHIIWTLFNVGYFHKEDYARKPRIETSTS